ncbi:hypothetical protein [Dinoroseobacter sp. S76]|uniref:hypothetical protein n=1 Tax=Dinoroseobacter sp. S76 TaxID=3415124 RepID=UPI003C79C7A6
MTWTNARMLLRMGGVATGHGWDQTLKKVEETGVEVEYGKLEDCLVEHLLCGEKFTKLYPVDPSQRSALQAKIVEAELSEAPAAKAYPYLVPDDVLSDGTGDLNVVRVESNEDGVGILFSSLLWVKTREEISFEDFGQPEDMRGRYEEVIGLARRPVQMYHVVWLPHHRDFLEVRVDSPRGIVEADIHALHSRLKDEVNSWGVASLEGSVNLFPAVRPFYDDATEGTVTQMTFQTTTGAIKDEKMPRRRRDADQRTEAYHVAGKEAVDAIAIYRITVEWGFREDDLTFIPSVTLAASGPSGGNSKDPLISGALIKNCVRASDYEFAIERLGKKAKLEH